MGPQGNRHRRDRDAGADGDARGISARAAAARRAHLRLAAHDDPDRRADRDAQGARAPTCAGPRATSTRRRTMRPPRSPPAAPRCSPIKGETLKDYWDYQHRIFEWGDGGAPNMILDDGGDATLLIHLGLRAEQGETGFISKPTNEEEEVLFAAIKQRLQGQARLVQKECRVHPRRDRRDHDRRAPPLRDAEEGHAAVAGNQRQRQRHQIEIRQSLRLPRVAGRRHPPRHRRDDGRQGRHGRGLRRRRQGLGRLAAPGRLPRHGLRDRSDLRPAGGDGRLRGHDHGRCGAARRHLRHRHRQPRRDHHRAHARDEGPRHRLPISAISTARSRCRRCAT